MSSSSSNDGSGSRFAELKSARALEEEVLAFWKDERIFERSLRASEGRPSFVFYEGPPTANGTPHNGHVLTRVIKDLFPRYKTMRGYHVDRKAGWDTHGLPVEIEVEKELGIRARGADSREAVLAYGLDNFAQRCIESVFKYTSEWEELTESVGFWVDLGEAYVTYHREYVESVWWALAELYRRGHLYQGKKIVWWWPEGGTALSNGEVGEGYRDVDDPSVTVRFAVVGQPDTYLLAWTTTPWTLPSNVALAVGPDLDYTFVKVQDGDRTITVIAAESLAPEGDVVEVVKGRDLVGWTYEPLFAPPTDDTANVDLSGRSYVVVGGEHVSLGSGTGIVHTAPAYGEDDFALGRDEGLGIIAMVGPDGKFVASAPEFVRGQYFKHADKAIIRDLKERGLMQHSGTVRHSYPFSPRSKDDALMQLARPGWFIGTRAFKDQALENNAQVNWLPGHIQDGRFGDFLRNNVDWALSRERFWGTPLPIWQCRGCDHEDAFESVEALEAAGAKGFDPTVDPHLQVHRPWVDRIVVPCPHCGGQMHRVVEVIDCWFDSGCMPFAQWGFPHRGQERFRASFPADFISEAVDQTRGWFYSLMMISTLLFDQDTCEKYGLGDVGWPRPYKNCIVLGLVSDMDGKKESKSVGNYTSPHLVLKGTMRMRYVADDSVPRGKVGMVEAAVRSIDLNPKERLTLTATEQGADGVPLSPVKWPHPGKETVALNPADVAEAGLSGGSCWLRAPFEPPGADAFRWLFYASNPPWTNTRLSLRAIREGARDFHLRLGNVYQFFSIYANLSDFDPTTDTISSELDQLDRWVLIRCDQLVRVVTARLDEFLIYEAAREIRDFVEDLSNWYVRRSRSRFWGDGPDARAALQTLYRVLCTLTRVIAPFTPFLAEALYQRLEGGHAALPSVHMQAWPTAPATARDADLAFADDMALVREICSLGLAARARVGVKVRQPLRAVELVLAEPDRAARLSGLLELVRDELNVREVHFSARAEDFVSFQVKPDYPALGKKLGKEMKLCASALAKAEGAEVRRAILSGAGFPVELPSGTIHLTGDEVRLEVVPREGFQAAGSASVVVALHADLDEDLLQEGLSREVMNRIQVARKDLELDYADRIVVVLRGDDAVVAAVERFSSHIARETLATSLSVGPATAGDEGELDGHVFHLDVRRA
ncbi:MAG: isoleucine--tRNA ligase [Alphaproteobacteria bacterium]|nr:isoleucine--tRNA ligase [Alphaproteobacteria bacterium]